MVLRVIILILILILLLLDLFFLVIGCSAVSL